MRAVEVADLGLSEDDRARVRHVASWVESSTGRELTEGQARAVTVLAETASNAQPWNVPLISGWSDATDYHSGLDPTYDCGHDGCECPPSPPVVFHERFVAALLRGELASFDGSALTRLVVAAHRYAVRVSVAAAEAVAVDEDAEVMVLCAGEWVRSNRRPHYVVPVLKLLLHPRVRDAKGWERHPTIEQVIDGGRR